MDPNANITEQRDLAREILDLCDGAYTDDGKFIDDAGEEIAEKADRLAELVQALDEWRRKGGFDPYKPNQERR